MSRMWPLARAGCSWRSCRKTNIAVSNLEYATRPCNVRHAYRLGLMRAGGVHETAGSSEPLAAGPHARGRGHPAAKLTNAQVREIRAQLGCVSQKERARWYGPSKAAINAIIRGRNWVDPAAALTDNLLIRKTYELVGRRPKMRRTLPLLG